MGRGISEVLPFAIGVAISPIPIIAVILMLFSERAKVNGPVFLAGWVIGLSVVAIGTSSPEIVTTVVATLKGDRDVAVGNLLGSSIYNILCILGLVCVVSPGGIEVERLPERGNDAPVRAVHGVQRLDRQPYAGGARVRHQVGDRLGDAGPGAVDVARAGREAARDEHEDPGAERGRLVDRAPVLVVPARLGEEPPAAQRRDRQPRVAERRGLRAVRALVALHLLAHPGGRAGDVLGHGAPFRGSTPA